jgi:hypothetical protein
MNNYDSVSERLPEEASFEMKFQKFAKIVSGLNQHGINLAEAVPNPVLEDSSCGFRLTHNVNSWYIYRVTDIIDMIVSMRNDHIKRKNDKDW